MQEEWLWYLSGAFDTAGVISVKIQKHDHYAIGYDFRPMISFTRMEPKTVVFGMIDEYSEDKKFKYRIEDQSNEKSHQLVIDDPKSIERFLNPLLGGFVQQREQAEIMLDEIIPEVNAGHHRTKEGFYDLMDAVEILRETTYKRRSSKYTKEYFMKEWKMR